MLAPFQHHKTVEGFTYTTAPVLTYFQIHLPFTRDQIQYHDNWVYMKAGSMHHIFSYGNGRPLWNYFCMDGITSDQIYVTRNGYCGTFYVHHDRILYRYLYVTRTLKPIVIDNRQICLLQDHDDDFTILCASNKNTLVNYDDPNEAYAMLEDDEQLLGDSGTSYDESIVIISSPKSDLAFVRGKTLCINVREAVRYHIFRDCVLVIDKAHTVYIFLVDKEWDRDHFQPVSSFTIGKHTHSISQGINLPEPVEDIYILDRRNKIICIRANDRYYVCKLDDKPNPLEEITLAPVVITMPTIDLTQIDRPKCDGDPICVKIETYASRCERLALLAEMFGIYYKYEISIDRKGIMVSHGPGVKKVFVQDALSQFASRYLIQHNACTSINLAAVEALTAPQLFAYGRMLHLAIAMAKQQLSIRLPVILLAAILGRELTIPELEYMAAKENPELFESIKVYSHDPSGLIECGYDTYQECLEHTIHYYGTCDHASHGSLREVCRVIAAGIGPIKNRKLMNLPTLDYYMSGDYSIDRSRLVGLISYHNLDELVLENPITEIIDTLTEEQLAILLKNWGGTTVVQNRSYVVNIVDDEDMFFATCSTTLTLPRSAIDESVVSREALIGLLTTPVNYIEN